MTKQEKAAARLVIDVLLSLLARSDLGDFETDELSRALIEARKVLEPKRRKRK